MSVNQDVKRVDVYGFDFGDIWNNCADNTTLSVQKTIKVHHKEDSGL